MSYEAWRISYQSSEQAARAAYSYMQDLRERMLALEAQRDEYHSKEWQAVKDLRAANKLLEQVKKERDLYLDILRQPKWMNALGDNIG